jgi:predicted metalloprotease with PDZ domain
MKKLFILFFLTPFISFATMKIQYSLSFPEPQTHYIEVSLTISGHKNKALDLKMPVWTPGSYLVREFSRHVESLSSSNGKTAKLAKNHWHITPNNTEDIKISYKVYAFELSVRTSFVDADMALLNGASIFFRIDTKENLPYEVSISPASNWKQINTSLKNVNENAWKLTADNFDELIDSPILLGNQAIHSFEVNGIVHIVAMAGQVEYDPKRLTTDMKTICTEATKVIGEHPCKDYTFIIVNASSGSGGLEHANSCVLHNSRTAYTNEGQYKNFLGLVAHEYFHLWNVKRIRPIELGPFDYDNENYTSMLWISEGFTSYYDDLICQRAGILTSDRLIEISASNINTIENAPGNKIQPVCEASFDAWIKYYRSNENSNNATTNYYSKGSVLALMLDIEIISTSNGKKTLDDLMKVLYKKYYKELKRGFTEAEFQKETEAIVGKKLDDFFLNYVQGTKTIDYNYYFDKAGLKLTNLNAGKADLGLGASIGNAGGRMTVTSVLRNAPAWKCGLNVNDEIIAIDNYRVGSDISQFVNQKNAGDSLNLLINRDGLIRKLEIVLEPYLTFSFKLEKVLEPDEIQLAILKKWLNN